jgi:hypothetical protein
MWSLIRDPHGRKRRNERTDGPSREGRLRGPLLGVGGLLGGGWFATTQARSDVREFDVNENFLEEMLSERRDKMAHRSSRHRVRSIAALALKAGTTIGPRCANVHGGREDQHLHTEAGYTPAPDSVGIL